MDFKFGDKVLYDESHAIFLATGTKSYATGYALIQFISDHRGWDTTYACLAGNTVEPHIAQKLHVLTTLDNLYWVPQSDLKRRK